MASSSPTSRPTTPTPARKEIAASDDEDSDGGFSDDSLEDLSTLLGGPRPQAAPRREDLLATPKAKRAAHHSHQKPPLAIIPKHKFDLKALAKDARRDTALQASSLRAQEPLLLKSSEPTTATATPEGMASVVSDIVSGGDGGSANGDTRKVLRGLERADLGNEELRYSFFRTEFEPPGASRPPVEAQREPWTLLTKGNARVREQNLASGLPYTIVLSQGGMPDAVFVWVLDEICAAKSLLVRSELCNLIRVCPEQIARLFTPGVLQSMWDGIGVADTTIDDGEISISRVGGDVYQGREWSHLQSVMILLQGVASHLSLATTKYAIEMLIRMAMDRVILTTIELDTQYASTMKALLETIPPENWDSFVSHNPNAIPRCHHPLTAKQSYDLCTLIKSNFTSQVLRVHALLCLPVSSYRAHNLRRRLAIAFLFSDTSLSRRPPEDVLTLQHVLDRLSLPDFQVGPGTEFAELRAAVLILDMAVDDGSVLAFGPDDAAGEREFNAQVDALADKLNEIWRRTNDTGMKIARTEAKSVVEWVQKRVIHTVRTRRKRPKSIFDLPGQEDQENNRRSLPKQQEFMKNFFRKKPEAQQPREPEPEPTPEPKVKREPRTRTPRSQTPVRKTPRRQVQEPDSDSEPEIIRDSIVVKGV